MIEIVRFAVENLEENCVTDKTNPVFSWAVSSDENNTVIKTATITVAGFTFDASCQVAASYTGPALKPFTRYDAVLNVTDERDNSASSSLIFETGRMNESWKGGWITDTSYRFTEKKVSPVPMAFKKEINAAKKISRARIYATALGIYELYIDGNKVGDRYFAPGFTSYGTNLMYQTYDATSLLKDNSQVVFYVAGGWAVGSFVFTRKNRVTADRQALLAEIRIEYEDGSKETIGTDSSWDVTMSSQFRMADLYDGETYDGRVKIEEAEWKKAGSERIRIKPYISADYGSPVKCHEVFKPVAVIRNREDKAIYDFGQNFAGVIVLKIKNAQYGQKVMVRHAEILNPDKTLNTRFLRSARATATYICHAGEQEYSPSFTYMGFRYAEVSGIKIEDIDVSAVAMYSDLRRTGSFECSSPLINSLQSNIVWSSKSNLFDIPTDCPQRDERMGWTGDIAVFSPTACFNFDMSRFLDKWLRDVKAEQLPTGGIPNTVPVQGYGFPATMPKMAVDWWGDACVLVPWNEYMARGDKDLLRKMYPVMKRYVNACKRWASLFSLGKRRYIWNTPGVIHFGDWVSPDVPKMQQWQARAKWTATASLFNTSRTLAKVADVLGYKEDSEYYRIISYRTARAYEDVFTDKVGKLKTEFQTGYVLPVYLNMFRDKETKSYAVKNLKALVEKNGYCIGTGFPGTPYILFALADNGEEETAYRMLFNTKCPSWLYEVKSGATTVWERWDGLDERGECPIGNDGTDNMISYNHYASGSVGAFLYQRMAGIQPLKAGYKEFEVKPLFTEEIDYVSSSLMTPYGMISMDYRKEGENVALSVEVPVGTKCSVLQDKDSLAVVGSGRYTFKFKI